MNGKQLLEAMSEIDEAYIEDAGRSTGRRMGRWYALGAVAACLAVVLAGGRFFWSSIIASTANRQFSAMAVMGDSSEAAAEKAIMDEAAPALSAASRMAEPELRELTVTVTGLGETTVSAAGADGEELILQLPDGFACAPGDQLLIRYEEQDPDTGILYVLECQLIEK